MKLMFNILLGLEHFRGNVGRVVRGSAQRIRHEAIRVPAGDDTFHKKLVKDMASDSQGFGAPLWVVSRLW
jgi:hypothetical protein